MSWLISKALMEVYENSRCSQERAAEFSAATSSDGARSALSSGSPTPQAFLPHDKMTAFSRPSRSGMTFAPLTDALGADLLTWFLADSRVRTYPLLALAPESTASAPACGERWPASLAKYDPATSSWKTAQLSLLADSDEFSETWPSWGMTRNGECWERTMLEPLTEGSASGLRPTPTVCGNYNRKGASKTSGDGLATAVASRSIKSCSESTDAPIAKATTYPTPTATMHKGWSKGHNRADSDDRLDYTIERQAFQPGQETPPKRLNPAWVEWLMGWPPGWTDLKPLETARFREWQRQHSPCSASDKEYVA